MVPEEHLQALQGEVEALQEMVYGLLSSQRTGKSVAITQPGQFIIIPEAETSTARIEAATSTPRASQHQSFAFDEVNMEPPSVKPSPQQQPTQGTGVKNTLAVPVGTSHKDEVLRLYESTNGTGVKNTVGDKI